MNKKRGTLLFIITALLVVCALCVQALIGKRAEQKRQVEYQFVLKEYSDVLKPGMTRREVESYLNLRGRPFQQMCCVQVRRDAWADLMRIGQEKAPWYCSERNIYVAFEFERTEPPGKALDALDSDRLESVVLYPWLEGCL